MTYTVKFLPPDIELETTAVLKKQPTAQLY